MQIESSSKCIRLQLRRCLESERCFRVGYTAAIAHHDAADEHELRVHRLFLDPRTARVGTTIFVGILRMARCLPMDIKSGHPKL
jgi:hypothetical protein